MLPDLISLALFLRAVETRSLSKAAEQSHIALAAASRRIALLEHRYRVILLYRSSKGVAPTPAGAALAIHARRMIEQADKLSADLSDYAKGVRGHLRIQANTSAITQYLPQDLAKFSAEYPDLKLELEENRSVQIVQALPALVLVIAGAAFLQPSFLVAAILIALTGWTDAARLVRAGTQRLRNEAFVDAARASGASDARLLFVHVLPHALPPALATLPYVLGSAVLTEAGLSFLGLGAPPPAASWGRALAEARNLLPGAWWCVLPPGIALFLLVFSARRLGDAFLGRRGDVQSRLA